MDYSPIIPLSIVITTSQYMKTRPKFSRTYARESADNSICGEHNLDFYMTDILFGQMLHKLRKTSLKNSNIQIIL